MGVLLTFIGNSALWVIIVGFGGFGRVGSNPGYARAGQEMLVVFLFFFVFDFGVWLPCMLAWWRLLSLSGCDACWVTKPTRAPGGKSGLKQDLTFTPVHFLGKFASS